MADTYIIAAISEKVNNWSNAHGDFTTYNVRLEGKGDEAVQINKRSDSPAPKVGDEIYGELTSTEWGIKFKSQKKPFGGNTSNHRSSENPETQDAIFRSVALEHAVVYSQRFTTGKSVENTVEIADKFYEWLTGSSAGNPLQRTQASPPSPQSEEKARETRKWDQLGKDKEEPDDQWDESMFNDEGNKVT